MFKCGWNTDICFVSLTVPPQVNEYCVAVLHINLSCFTVTCIPNIVMADHT